MTHRFLLPLLIVLGACDSKDDTATDDTSPTDDTAPQGFGVTGVALNLLDQQPAPVGLCVYAADPTDAIAGGDIMDSILAETTVGAGGAYTLTGIVTTSAVGLLILVQDCADEGTVMPTATGMAKETYEVLAAGDTLADYPIFSVDAGSQTAFQGGLALAGYTGDIGTDGALLGFVYDTAGMPVDGAVVAGPGSATTYYYAGPTAGFVTTGTVAAAGAMFIIPGAPIYSYTCTADGHTFDSIMAGSQPGYAVLVKFNAI